MFGIRDARTRKQYPEFRVGQRFYSSRCNNRRLKDTGICNSDADMKFLFGLLT